MRIFRQRGPIGIRHRQSNLGHVSIGVYENPVKSPGLCTIDAQGDAPPITGGIRHRELDIAQTVYALFV